MPVHVVGAEEFMLESSILSNERQQTDTRIVQSFIQYR